MVYYKENGVHLSYARMTLEQWNKTKGVFADQENSATTKVLNINVNPTAAVEHISFRMKFDNWENIKL